MDNRSKANLDLIVALENNQQVSQTKLAKRIGIAAGLVNILLKRAVNRGFVKMTQIPARRYAYYLTPQGFAEKAKLVGKYLNSSLSLYRRLRVEYRDLFASLEARGISEVTLVGDTDIAEIAIMASFESKLHIIAVVNASTNLDQVGPIPIIKKLPVQYDGMVMITDARKPQGCYDEIVKAIDPKQVIYPLALCISNNQSANVDEVT